jgi:gas vesicle structural protein
MAKIKRTLNASSSRAEVIELILTKGIIVDAWASIALIGLRLIEIDVKLLIASLDTYTKYADALRQTIAMGENILVPIPA